nr:MAG TPA: hypothetical protein [Caudoviricetes sp.]
MGMRTGLRYTSRRFLRLYDDRLAGRPSGHSHLYGSTFHGFSPTFVLMNQLHITPRDSWNHYRLSGLWHRHYSTVNLS